MRFDTTVGEPSRGPSSQADYGDVSRAVDPRKLDLRGAWRLLVRRRWLILVTIFTISGSSALVIELLAPHYSAEALLLVGERQPTLLDIRDAVRGSDSGAVESEVEILRSQRIAEQVVKKLDLTRDPTFNAALHREGWLARTGRSASTAVEALLGTLSSWFPKSEEDRPTLSAALATLPTPSQDEIAVSRSADVLLRHLTIAVKGRSRVVGVGYESTDPRLAAAVANAVVDGYVDSELSDKMLENARANEWLAKRVADLRDQVVDTDRQVQQRKVEAGVTDGRQAGLIQEQVAGLSEQLTVAHADSVRATARLRQAQQVGPDEVTSDFLDSPVVQKLQVDRAELQRRIAEMQHLFGEEYPALIKLRAQLGDLNASLIEEKSKIVAALSGDAATAKAREDALQTGLNSLKGQAAKIGAADVDILAQQREADASRALFDRILSRAKEASVESGLQKADDAVIAHAIVPDKPTFPNKPVFLAIAFLAAAAAAGLIVFAVESLDQGFRDLEEVESALGVPALGFIPVLPSRAAPELYATERPRSAYAEGVRSAYTSLMLADVNSMPKLVLITSSLPGEGKTTLSAALARVMAATGRKVLLVDCDLRRRDLSRVMGVPSEPGLLDVLRGTVGLSDVISRDTLTGAYVLSAGKRAANPPDVLGSNGMRNLLAALRESYDLVIMDSAPLLAVSDTRSVCRLADKVVMAVRWQHTRKAAAIPALKHIKSAGGDVAGILLTRTDMKRLTAYSANAYYGRKTNEYLPQ